MLPSSDEMTPFIRPSPRFVENKSEERFPEVKFTHRSLLISHPKNKPLTPTMRNINTVSVQDLAKSPKRRDPIKFFPKYAPITNRALISSG
jgi:hypothetical protein